MALAGSFFTKEHSLSTWASISCVPFIRVSESCKRNAHARQHQTAALRTLVLLIFFLVARMAFSAVSRGRFLPASLDILKTVNTPPQQVTSWYQDGCSALD